MKNFLRRLFCFHDFDDRAVSWSIKRQVAEYFGMTTWICSKCGKELIRNPWERSIRYLGGRCDRDHYDPYENMGGF